MTEKLLMEKFSFDLPPQLIAQKPAVPRDSSRLMVVDRSTGEISHHIFRELAQFLKEGTLVVRNNTKVLASRLFARKATGGRVEILLMYPEKNQRWKGLVKGRKIHPPQKLVLDKIELEIEVVEKDSEGIYTIQFPQGITVEEILDQAGYMPLPPYIKRDYSQSPQKEDQSTYQTVYASQPGAYAAPTAGLHFTSRTFEDLQKKGIDLAEVTLHVGMGTFKPVQCNRVEDHKMHREYYRIPAETLQKIQSAPSGPILSVGTTTLRTLEAYYQTQKPEDWTDIFIYPPYQIQSAHHLLTNFHLPKSTLLLLVSAFANWEIIQRAYHIGIEQKYRFFSYGDGMLIL